MTPCDLAGVKVGNLRRRTLVHTWSNPHLATLSDDEDSGDRCAVCDHRHHCGGCRASASAYTGDMQGGGPGGVYNCRQCQEVVQPDTNQEAERMRPPRPLQAGPTNWFSQSRPPGAVRALAESRQATKLPEADVRYVDALSDRSQILLPASRLTSSASI